MTSRGSAGSSGHFRSTRRPARPSTSMNRSCGRGPWWPSTPETTETFITFWRTIGSLKILTPSCRPCGSRPTIRRQRSCEADPSVPSTSIASEKSIPCLGQSGTGSRRRIVSRNALGTYCGNGTCRTPTQILPKNESWPKVQD